MVRRVSGAIVCAGVGLLLRSTGRDPAKLFGQSLRNGRPGGPVALTFDDGPSESSLRVLDVLSAFGVRATFFLCGFNVGRLRTVASEISRCGHEVGNHSYSHPNFHFRSAEFIRSELQRTQMVIESAVGVRPRWFRPPFGLKWFGMAAAQKELSLTRVLWTHGGSDWKDPADAIAKQVTASLSSGSIICLHDGRGLQAAPDIGQTIGALELILKYARDQGIRVGTVSDAVLEPAASAESYQS